MLDSKNGMADNKQIGVNNGKAKFTIGAYGFTTLVGSM